VALEIFRKGEGDMKVKVKPLGEKVLIKRLEPEEKTAGGIVLPETAKEKPKQGRVIELGEGRLLESGERAKTSLKKGDRVIFTSYAGTEVKIEGEEYLLMSQEDILAVLE
jgi:chaperonin GroES